MVDVEIFREIDHGLAVSVTSLEEAMMLGEAIREEYPERFESWFVDDFYYSRYKDQTVYYFARNSACYGSLSHALSHDDYRVVSFADVCCQLEFEDGGVDLEYFFE